MYTDTLPLQPIIPGYHLEILDVEKRRMLKAATLEILDETGVHCPSEKALHLYAEHGARVDFSSQIVRLSPDLVLNAMAHAPRFYNMAARLQSLI